MGDHWEGRNWEGRAFLQWGRYLPAADLANTVPAPWRCTTRTVNTFHLVMSQNSVEGLIFATPEHQAGKIRPARSPRVIPPRGAGFDLPRLPAGAGFPLAIPCEHGGSAQHPARPRSLASSGHLNHLNHLGLWQVRAP
eukprot:gene14534-biopygen10901